MIWFYPDNIEIGEKCRYAPYWNAQQPLWVTWYHGNLLIRHIASLSLGFMSSNMADKYYFRNIISLRGACCDFNIANLYKRPQFVRYHLIFLPFVAFYKAYHLQKFWIGRSKMCKYKKFNSLRGVVANFNIAQIHIYLRFKNCLDETISSNIFSS